MSMEKPQYPTDEWGLPVVPDSTACYEVCLKGVNQKNQHHLAWPRHEYTTRLERQYRSTACMAIKICMCLHEDLHASYLPPEAPRRSVMDDVVNGELAPQRAEDAGVVLHIRSKAQINEENLSRVDVPESVVEAVKTYVVAQTDALKDCVDILDTVKEIQEL